VIADNASSREAANECNPRRKPWVSDRRTGQAPAGRKNLAHTTGNVVIHLIFSTKGRQPPIIPEMRSDLFAYLGGIVREFRGTALIINGTNDHVHLLIRIRPAQAVAEVARVVKTNSSRWAHEKWHAQFAWQTGYGAFSVSESNVPEVSRYIAKQPEHHRKRSFQQEFVAFSRRTRSNMTNVDAGFTVCPNRTALPAFEESPE